MSLRDVLVAAYVEAAKVRSAHAEKIGWMVGSPPSGDRLVTHENYMRAPLNRWGFKNLEKLTRSTTVFRGNGPVLALPRIKKDLSKLAFSSRAGVSVSVHDHLLATFTDGFIVLKDGSSVYEAYFDGYQEHDRHIMFSVTKSIVGLITEDFVVKGVIDDALLASDYVPELAGTMFGDATVRQIMDMVVGYDYIERYDDPLSNTSLFGYASGLWQPPAGSVFADNIFDYLVAQVKKGEHGEQFRYVTACTEAMTWIVERASGESIATLVESIWSKLGCERDGYFVNDATGRVCTGGGFNATLCDMARFALMVSQKGQCNGEQLLSVNTVDRLFLGANPALYALNKDFSQWLPGASYRSQWYVYEGESIMAVGIHGQVIYIHKASNVVIVKQSSAPAAESPLDLDTVVMLKTIAESLL